VVLSSSDPENPSPFSEQKTKEIQKPTSKVSFFTTQKLNSSNPSSFFTLTNKRSTP